MRIKINLIDERDGNVRIDCTPPLANLLTLWRGRLNDEEAPASLRYAIVAMSQMVGFSEKIETQVKKEERERAALQGIILPFKDKKEEGPQIEDFRG